MTNHSDIKNQDIHNSVVVNNVTQVLVKSAEYKDLIEKLKIQETLLELMPVHNVEKRDEIKKKIEELMDFIQQFEADVLQLAALIEKSKV